MALLAKSPGLKLDYDNQMMETQMAKERDNKCNVGSDIGL